ncbi:uncharacterized protein LOC131629574 [Vicia villosa]|uniref:uncharacterized protein LOC131629574 n=1 Tax=Vicia villosa TaxID=3911 RepID=UPI00273C6FAA|nr:uncharacterized protein LOC131629574 [Vicia villosa]
MVARRNDDVISEELPMFVGAIVKTLNVNAGNREEDEFRAFGKFLRNNTPIFEEIEKIFREAEDWWGNTVQRFDEEGIEVTWAHFRDAFLENYFLEDVRGKKEVEFLELKQGNGTMAEYAARFQELIKYCPHYNTANAERSKCLKFVNGLILEIKKAIGYQPISHFIELVNKNRIYDKFYLISSYLERESF